MTFFAVLFLSAHVPLLLFTDIGRPETPLIATILGLHVMRLELMAWDGLDNLFIPLGGIALLSDYLNLPAGPLVTRMIATILLAAFVFAWRRRSRMDDGALVAAAFFDYLTRMIGGWTFLQASLALFVVPALLRPRRQEQRQHTVRSVLTIVAPGLLWLSIFAATHWPGVPITYATVFAAHAECNKFVIRSKHGP